MVFLNIGKSNGIKYQDHQKENSKKLSLFNLIFSLFIFIHQFNDFNF